MFTCGRDISVMNLSRWDSVKSAQMTSDFLSGGGYDGRPSAADLAHNAIPGLQRSLTACVQVCDSLSHCCQSVAISFASTSGKPRSYRIRPCAVLTLRSDTSSTIHMTLCGIERAWKISALKCGTPFSAARNTGMSRMFL